MRKQQLLILILLNICFIAQGQISTTNYDNKVILQSYQNSRFVWPFTFEDYDNINNLCFSLATDTAVNIYFVDNDLNVLDVLSAEKLKFFHFKLNDKVYGVTNHMSVFPYFDSTSFYSNYLNGDRFFNKIVFSKDNDTRKHILMSKCFITRNKEIAFFFLNQDKNTMQLDAKLFIVDTIGEIKASNSYNQIALDFPAIYETDSNFTIIESFPLSQTSLPKSYYIDKVHQY